MNAYSPNSITPTSPKLPHPGKFQGSRRNRIWAKGDVTGLSRTCRGRYGEVGIVEFELMRAYRQSAFSSGLRGKGSGYRRGAVL